jgi:isocitrate/isopropylmalate dehydrogenase
MLELKMTRREIEELLSSATGVYTRLKRDLHVSKEELDFWWGIVDKLTMTLVRNPKK